MQNVTVHRTDKRHLHMVPNRNLYLFMSGFVALQLGLPVQILGPISRKVTINH